MLVMAWVVGLGLVTLVFNEQLKEQFNPNRQPETRQFSGKAEVVLKQNRGGHYITSGVINNQAVVFLLDTGATSVSVPLHLAKLLNLQAGVRYSVQTANGVIQVAKTTIDELSIGNIRLFNVPANINPADQSNDILLGMSALRQLEFTQKDDALVLREL